MGVDLIRGIMPGNVNSHEKRRRDVQDEGCSQEFGLMLQSLMPLQVAYAEEAGGADGNGMPPSEDLSSASQALLKATEAALKIPIQTPGDTGLHEFDGTPQESIFRDGQAVPFGEQLHPVSQHVLSEQMSSRQLYPMVEECDGAVGQFDGNVAAFLHSADSASGLQDRETGIQEHGFEVVYDTPDGDLQPVMNEPLVLDTQAYDDQMHVVEKMLDIRGKMTLKKDGTVKSSRMDSFDGMSSQYRGSPINLKAADESSNAKLMASRIRTMQQGMHEDGAILDEAREDLQPDFNHGQEGLAVERLYANGQLRRTFNAEMSSVYGERPVDFHAMLADVADRVRVLLSDKRSEMEVLLKPPELGRMVLKVAMEGGTLAVRITVESNAVKDFLQSHTHELKALLAQKGYSFTNIDVNIGQGYQQLQRDGVGSGWQWENPMPRRIRPGIAEARHSIVRPAAYYDGHHRLDCLA